MLPNNNNPKPIQNRLNILIVNIKSDAEDTLRDKLRQNQHIIAGFANSAKEALHILRHQSIDLLIGAVESEELDGWRLSRLVRSGILKCRPDIPIIMLSSTWCERIAEVTAREYGVNELLPISDIDLIPERLQYYLDNPTATLARPKLLVVEDQVDTADLIARVLNHSYSIDVAYDGAEGVRMWREGQYDLVLLDVMLPHKNGREVLHEIMAEKPEQAVVIMTANTSVDQAQNLMLDGAADFLPKPFRAEQLRKVCHIATLREDYLISNEQFAARVESLKEREEAFRKLSESHHRLLDDLQSVVIKLDENLNIKFLNRTWENVMGHSIASSLNQPMEVFLAEEHHATFPRIKNKLREALQKKHSKCEMELCFLGKDNQKIWTQLKVISSTSIDSSINLTICLDDITERIKTQKQLEHLAMHDSLTGLFNRHYFDSSLEQITADAKRYHRTHGLVYVDLDYFKVINDTFGHQRGDEVLREIASVLKRRIRHSDILCRLGGDEFAVLLHDVNEDSMLTFAREIQQAVGSCTFQLQDQSIHLGASIGLASINGSLPSHEEYLMQADIALYVAKGRGRNLIHFFDPEDQENENMRSNINWSQKIREAIQEDRLHLTFQPVLNMETNSVSYYEALVRYTNRDGSIVVPGEFIPALENTGEMQILDRHIIKLAVKCLRDYPQLNHIAINLSAQAFKDDNLVPIIMENLELHQIKAEQLTFELTESASLFNLNVTQRVISKLHALGCKFSVDDFGSGFSSFSYLKQLPADYIKLDGSFIKNLDKDPVDQALVRSIIPVIQALGKKAVAEYVENEKILATLKQMKVDYVQGYYIGRPTKPDDLFPE
ncbi:Cyclic di-GMP phosphodiesterase PdeB [Thalassocella blandensis]|nr:Cyclic di-GMP phosphodiesterase PdeB [Thalassocella blandensis]